MHAKNVVDARAYGKEVVMTNSVISTLMRWDRPVLAPSPQNAPVMG
ncbi:hypothetical protein [Streptomyces avermitilis]|nr:hypothetical protein [Streptomyces avermitilis]